MKIILVFSFVVFGLSALFGQSRTFLTFYDWKKSPKLHELADSIMSEPEYILLDKYRSDFIFNNQGNLEEYHLHHQITRVNSDKAIERNNRVYLPLDGVINVIKEKARVIKPDGSVMELDKSDIKEAVDEEEEESYRYFALEGVEKGSEIEYFFVYIRSPRYVGHTLYFQDDIPRKEVTFTLNSPENLVFAFNSYNGFPEVEFDTTSVETLTWDVKANHIPALESEPFASYRPHLQQVAYKLEYNLARGRKPMFTYASMAQMYFEVAYPKLSRKERKGLESLRKDMKLPKVKDAEVLVRKMEDYIKKNFIMVSGVVGDLQNLKNVLDKKAGDEIGMLLLFCNLFEMEDIDHTIVLTSNRFRMPLDPDFESYHYLKDFLIYFPDLDKYLAPTSIVDRLGCIGATNTHNYGVFIEPIVLGDFKSAAAEVLFIEALPSSFSQNNLDINVDFASNFNEVNIDLSNTQTGYNARNYQPLYDYLDEEGKEDITEDLLKYYSEDANFLEKKVKHASSEEFLIHPFTLETKFKSKKFIEKAGPNYLFKVGELIGAQSELYGKDERQLPVENTFNREYRREIRFDVPEGYEFANLNDLNMDIYHETDGERSCAFTSEYKEEGGRITVSVYEFYDQITYPVEEYPAYQAVINAAADFNKITLLLEPQ